MQTRGKCGLGHLRLATDGPGPGGRQRRRSGELRGWRVHVRPCREASATTRYFLLPACYRRRLRLFACAPSPRHSAVPSTAPPATHCARRRLERRRRRRLPRDALRSLSREWTAARSGRVAHARDEWCGRCRRSPRRCAFCVVRLLARSASRHPACLCPLCGGLSATAARAAFVGARAARAQRTVCEAISRVAAPRAPLQITDHRQWGWGTAAATPVLDTAHRPPRAHMTRGSPPLPHHYPLFVCVETFTLRGVDPELTRGCALGPPARLQPAE